MNRSAHAKLQAIFNAAPQLGVRFNTLRKAVMPIKPSQYDVSNVCNLSCVGCLYFHGNGAWQGETELDYAAWLNLFQQEQQRGVNYAHFSGAEPAMNVNALRAASAVFQRGVIYSNGSKLIPTDVHFKIHISVWGEEEHEEKLRGKAVFDRALTNYKDDPRAVFIFTLSKHSLGQLESIAQKCHRHQVQLSFNHYSPPSSTQTPTEPFLRKHQQTHVVSTDSLVLTPHDYAEIHERIERLTERFPNTVIYSRLYGKWIAQNEGIYRIDPHTGNATNCASRLSHQMRHFAPNTLRITDTKCCSPNIECRTCRLYAMAYSSMIDRLSEHLDSISAFEEWLTLTEIWTTLFINDPLRCKADDRETIIINRSV
jgi:MoaA/NifB/PqqE/SkfB family radical SAM enzyme